MVARVLPQEFVVTERRKIVLEAIDGLQVLEQTRGLNRLQQAALDALERLYMRTVKHRGAILNEEALARPLAIARAAMEATKCVR